MAMKKSKAAEAVRRLYKSRKDKMVDGICGGLAEYLNVDPNVVRILWAASVLFGGVGILVYVIAMVMVPANPDHIRLKTDEKVNHSPTLVWGTVLILAGLVFMGRELRHLYGWPFGYNFHWFSGWGHFWGIAIPLGLILLGVAYLAGLFARGSASTEGGQGRKETAAGRRLARSMSDKKIGGVCSGVARTLNTDPTLVRLGFLLLALTNVGGMVLVYLILLVVLPKGE